MHPLIAASAPHAADALTVTTDQIKSWGLVGIIIIIVAAALVVGLVKSVVGRTVWLIAALGLLFLLFQQHASIEDSIKACDPHVLFLHLQISDSSTRAHCQSLINTGNG